MLKLLIFIFLSAGLVCASGCRSGNGFAGAKQAATQKAHDPVIVRADIIYDEGTALIPSVVMAANGDLIATWMTKSDLQPGAVAQFARSSDLGKTWSAPYLTMQSDNSLVNTDAYLQTLPDGNWNIGYLSCGIFEEVFAQADGSGRRYYDFFYAISKDDGQTFSERKRLNDPDRRDDFPQGRYLKLTNGDLLWPWGRWQPDPLHGFKRSTDGGFTWGPLILAWQDPPAGQPKKLLFNETAIELCADGSIIAIARTDVLVDKKFWQIKSFDNGQTWTPPRQIEPAGGSPALYCTPKGQLWLAYRDGGIGPGLALAVSDDHGDTWRFLYHLQDPKGEFEKLYAHIRYTDEDRRQVWRPSEGVAGYPWFQKLSESEVYVVFHLMNRQELPQKYAPDTDPYFIAGNVLRIP